eukprot:3790485-Heterocapsa_arctica.AAC.1
MKAEDQCHECKGKAKSVFIGSSYKIGASNYSGCGLWSPDDQSFNDNGPLKGTSQRSDRAEVRALVAALEKAEEEEVYVITDNQYVRDTAQYIAAGGTVHKGKHNDLWNIIEYQIHKMKNIRWVKTHLKTYSSTKAGVSFEGWFGNNEADIQAKRGAGKHGYTASQKNDIQSKVTLAKSVQEHMLNIYISYVQRSLVRADALKNTHIKGTPTGTKGRQIIRPEQMGHEVQTCGDYECCLECG